jgi:acetolactate synthase regulatory subunit
VADPNDGVEMSLNHSPADHRDQTVDQRRGFYAPAMPSETILGAVQQFITRFRLTSDRSLALLR